ncbi:hypothetical protein CHLRE_08g358200v5 [Chlamydomonas reinhardtii]|uniref:Protein kinase domain-containing protein n=1 Tax=Chlamydomonas reinhardtii TaxID=3055 RepID=A0A2K3DG38_CHLRE|nr:uncharacterized protein CHLRE_08g358200v5 [Chlamydomonas reinhardtii]PNW79504.1 hypothetical protein CHLRE_08g358200v5 [Chlamydomonas reinhardtii]
MTEALPARAQQSVFAAPCDEDPEDLITCPDEDVGAVLRLDRVVGKGGFAVVWRAFLDTLDGPKLCACKVLAPRGGMLPPSPIVRLFVRECSSLVNMEHPAVVRCFGLIRMRRVDFPEMGLNYDTYGMLLEFCEGGTLKDLLMGQIMTLKDTYTVREALGWLAEVASALQQFHNQDMPVIHRDIKPDNVLLQQPEGWTPPPPPSRTFRRNGSSGVSGSSGVPGAPGSRGSSVGPLRAPLEAKLADLGLGVRVGGDRSALVRRRSTALSPDSEALPTTLEGADDETAPATTDGDGVEAAPPPPPRLRPRVPPSAGGGSAAVLLDDGLPFMGFTTSPLVFTKREYGSKRAKSRVERLGASASLNAAAAAAVAAGIAAGTVGGGDSPHGPGHRPPGSPGVLAGGTSPQPSVTAAADAGAGAGAGGLAATSPSHSHHGAAGGAANLHKATLLNSIRVRMSVRRDSNGSVKSVEGLGGPGSRPGSHTGSPLTQAAAAYTAGAGAGGQAGREGSAGGAAPPPSSYFRRTSAHSVEGAPAGSAGGAGVGGAIGTQSSAEKLDKESSTGQVAVQAQAGAPPPASPAATASGGGGGGGGNAGGPNSRSSATAGPGSGTGPGLGSGPAATAPVAPPAATAALAVAGAGSTLPEQLPTPFMHGPGHSGIGVSGTGAALGQSYSFPRENEPGQALAGAAGHVHLHPHPGPLLPPISERSLSADDTPSGSAYGNSGTGPSTAPAAVIVAAAAAAAAGAGGGGADGGSGAQVVSTSAAVPGGGHGAAGGRGTGGGGVMVRNPLYTIQEPSDDAAHTAPGPEAGTPQHKQHSGGGGPGLLAGIRNTLFGGGHPHPAPDNHTGAAGDGAGHDAQPLLQGQGQGQEAASAGLPGGNSGALPLAGSGPSLVSSVPRCPSMPVHGQKSLQLAPTTSTATHTSTLTSHHTAGLLHMTSQRTTPATGGTSGGTGGGPTLMLTATMSRGSRATPGTMAALSSLPPGNSLPRSETLTSNASGVTRLSKRQGSLGLRTASSMVRPNLRQLKHSDSIGKAMRRVESLLRTFNKSSLPKFSRESQFQWVFALTGQAGRCVRAPEVFRAEPYNEKVDVFGFGVMMYELLARELLLVKYIGGTKAGQELGITNPQQYATMVCQGFRPPRNPRIPEAQWQLIQDCWHPDPVVRPDMSEVAAQLQEAIHTWDWQTGHASVSTNTPASTARSGRLGSARGVAGGRTSVDGPPGGKAPSGRPGSAGTAGEGNSGEDEVGDKAGCKCVVQ